MTTAPRRGRRRRSPRRLIYAALGGGALWLAVAALGGGDAAPARPQPATPLHVNQLGYLPDGPKRATLATPRRQPLAWRLLDAAGGTVAEGMTTPRGDDASAGRNVHVIDFGAVEATGDGFRLAADGARSPPFAIRPGLYDAAARAALSFFYPMRSGVAIDGAVAGTAYARPAGHAAAPGDGATNKGDRAVPCLPPETAAEQYGEAWTCDYTLDVAGGWYDAGDQGKYVVNGGIAVAQLLSAYERTLHVDGAGAEALGDGGLAVPEAGNGVPDILDEARWQLEFLLSMQVPEGEPRAGMAHHKVHDDAWTALPTLPHEDPRPRYLHRPSTAATLNLAAAAAQGARLYRPHDAAFAERLRAAAVRAYAAARAEPDLLPSRDASAGGGAYFDERLSDEFYWAAAELFVTTGEPAYLADLEASPHWRGTAFRRDGFDWANVAALGRLTLATVPSTLEPAARAAARASLVDAAERYLALQQGEPFGQPYAPESGRYAWGSSHLVAQNAIVLARAHDLSGDARFRRAALEAADYLFGRNALGLSYVTGFGARHAENQHSRWFAAQLDPALPHPPRGTLAGGPNSWLGDAVADAALAGCAPQLCYIDHIESFSTNEMTVNWNAALGQFAAWLAEQ
ncbi:glycoside hydrolase family 9 protein [Aquibium sp. A9E412]|uniref:glycoside hydrolase family 9 protein n=1 Tax=Aquibium sp. A9E412 TaxID=2976767 RepID=UPI0025B0CF76|nr:glycoside hydrolase family 9 protein [Aquibium sp. A9E412]MDN2566141.1 glycoside hydrolase family 9 protein [Aquibium sp. A9E412]